MYWAGQSSALGVPVAILDERVEAALIIAVDHSIPFPAKKKKKMMMPKMACIWRSKPLHLCWLGGWMGSGQAGDPHCFLSFNTTTLSATSSSRSSLPQCVSQSHYSI